ncbi:aldehyde dehydrogenase family protein [Nonomuraea sp. NPDC050556]|uniref:aldehyde dehydrogenase family protein n=1 Tax=Nonomuraea sp. NPDC050556 TaxID=3364369 RepID=UPI00378806A9
MRTPVESRHAHWIGGAWVPASGAIEVTDSHTEEVIATVPSGTAADVDLAVAAARRAFESWSATTFKERAEILRAVADGMHARQAELATLISREVGTPYMLSNLIQTGLPNISFASQAEILDTFSAETRLGNSVIAREPVGVVGAITPWNYPLHQIAAKLAPALAAGCTVVLKPSEVAPLNAYVLMEIMHEAGVPAGVVNLVSGVGPVVGEAIAAHPDVDMVTFTGSTVAGRRVASVAAATVKRVALELGGKSPLVVLPDADLGNAVLRGITGCYINSGQTCSALTRLVVPLSRVAEAEELAGTFAAFAVVGDPLDPATQLGPLVSALQRDRVRGHITRALDEGARLLTGGVEPPFETGFYVAPTVLGGVTSDMAVAQEEVFGPVLVVQSYDDSGSAAEQDSAAVAVANATVYGLAAGVFGGDADRALAVARRIRAGQVEVNGGTFNPVAPFGGYKQSGIGRELGRHGFEEYLETKAIQL